MAAIEKMNKKTDGTAIETCIAEEGMRQWGYSQENHVYSEERILLDYIRNGDVNGLNLYFEQEHRMRFPVVLKDVKRNWEYMCVVSVSLMARAAIEGGLTSGESFLINDAYLKRISVTKDISKFRELYFEAAHYFATQVNERKGKEYVNPVVNLCRKYIISHRTKKISLSEVASFANISPAHLCHLFKEYEGITITEYILNEKIDAACNMLKYADCSICEISVYLGFSSVSYFSRCFKKRKGESPKEYRKQNHFADFTFEQYQE
ncbi:AraC family transcriptional regulator [Lachnotalea sp. AF33-28]|nr:AraC family transcriptional regulator [Lachnotalea sp. AF33-28]